MSWKKLVQINGLIADNRMLRNESTTISERELYASRLNELYETKRRILNQMEE